LPRLAEQIAEVLQSPPRSLFDLLAPPGGRREPAAVDASWIDGWTSSMRRILYEF